MSSRMTNHCLVQPSTKSSAARACRPKRRQNTPTHRFPPTLNEDAAECPLQRKSGITIRFIRYALCREANRPRDVCTPHIQISPDVEIPDQQTPRAGLQSHLAVTPDCNELLPRTFHRNEKSFSLLSRRCAHRSWRGLGSRHRSGESGPARQMHFRYGADKHGSGKPKLGSDRRLPWRLADHNCRMLLELSFHLPGIPLRHRSARIMCGNLPDVAPPVLNHRAPISVRYVSRLLY